MGMTMKAMMAAAAMAVAAFGVGCASTGAPEAGAPTHRWVAQEDVSSTKYNFDNKVCAEESTADFHAAHNGDGGNAAHLRHGTPEFAHYEQCMQGKGYELATY